MEKEILNILKVMQNDIRVMQSNMETQLGNVETRLGNVETQLGENTQILKVLQHNSQVHKAEIDKLNITLARETGEIKGSIAKLDERMCALEETNKSIMEMYGEHEVAIRSIRRRPV